MRLGRVVCLRLIFLGLFTGAAFPRPLSAADQEPAPEAQEPFLWTTPSAGSFALSPLAGYSTGSDIEGLVLGFRGQFFLQHLQVSAGAQSIFISSGAMYAFGIEAEGSLGPFHAGLGIALDWYPGRTLDQVPSLTVRAGILFPTPFDETWLDLSYKPTIALAEITGTAYHTIQLGLVLVMK